MAFADDGCKCLPGDGDLCEFWDDFAELHYEIGIFDKSEDCYAKENDCKDRCSARSTPGGIPGVCKLLHVAYNSDTGECSCLCRDDCFFAGQEHSGKERCYETCPSGYEEIGEGVQGCAVVTDVQKCCNQNCEGACLGVYYDGWSCEADDETCEAKASQPNIKTAVSYGPWLPCKTDNKVCCCFNYATTTTSTTTTTMPPGEEKCKAYCAGTAPGASGKCMPVGLGDTPEEVCEPGVPAPKLDLCGEFLPNNYDHCCCYLEGPPAPEFPSNILLIVGVIAIVAIAVLLIKKKK